MDDFIPTILSDDEIGDGSDADSDIDIVASVVSRAAPAKKKPAKAAKQAKQQPKAQASRKRPAPSSEEDQDDADSSEDDEDDDDSDDSDSQGDADGFDGLGMDLGLGGDDGFAGLGGADNNDDAAGLGGSAFEHSQHIRDKISKRLAMREVHSESDDDSEAEMAADRVGGGGDGSDSEDEGKAAGKKGKGSGNLIVAPKTLSRPERQLEFHDLKLSQPLLRAISKQGWTAPTAVQMQTVPVALQGKDLLVNAETGSGKTGAFMLPVIQRLLFRDKSSPAIRVLVLLPTRELASQCLEVTEALAQFTDIRACLAVGGLNMQTQAASLRRNPDIVIATPGRIIDHVRNSQSVSLDDVEILILDEADRLLELGFTDEVREVIRMCPRQRQTMLFSATLTENVQDLVNLSLNQPVRVHIDPYLSVVRGLVSEFIRIRGDARSGGEGGFSGNLYREAVLLALCKRSFKSRVIVFVESKTLAHRLMIIFGLCGLRAAELHGNMTQLQRLEAITTFREQQVDFLICTDLAARGLDIPGVQTVINLSLPRKLRDYVHRVGRTARAGRSGRSVSLVGEAERPLLKKIMRSSSGNLINRTVPPEVVQKYVDRIRSFREDIKAIITEEHQEKMVRIAEMEANKARNLMLHEQEIMARPARTWFQTQNEKEEAREQSSRINRGEDAMNAKERKQLKRDQKQSEERARKKSLKDELRGLNRKEKRRKLLKIELEEARRERMANPEAHPPPPKKQKEAPTKKEKKEAAAAAERGEPLALPKRPRASRYADSNGSVSAATLADGDERFRIGAARQQKKREASDKIKEEKIKAKARRGGKGVHSFKSKKRFARR